MSPEARDQTEAALAALPVHPVPEVEDPGEREARWIVLHMLGAFVIGAVLVRVAAEVRMRHPWLNLPIVVAAGTAGSVAARAGVAVVEWTWPPVFGRPASAKGRFWTRFIAASFADTIAFQLLAELAEGRSLPRGTSRWAWTIIWPLGVLALAANAVENETLRSIAANRRALFSDRTDLRGHRAVDPDIEKVIESGIALTVIYLDLDGFKAVNDELGHDIGDAVLREVGSALASVTATAYHISGDEFVLLLRGHDEDRDERTAREALQRIGEVGQRRGVPLGASFGAHQVDASGPVAAGSIRRDADLAMLSAKSAGKRRLRLASGRIVELDAAPEAERARDNSLEEVR